MWYSPQSKFKIKAKYTILYNAFEIILLIINATYPRANELNCVCRMAFFHSVGVDKYREWLLFTTKYQILPLSLHITYITPGGVSWCWRPQHCDTVRFLRYKPSVKRIHTSTVGSPYNGAVMWSFGIFFVIILQKPKFDQTVAFSPVIRDTMTLIWHHRNAIFYTRSYKVKWHDIRDIILIRHILAAVNDNPTYCHGHEKPPSSTRHLMMTDKVDRAGLRQYPNRPILRKTRLIASSRILRHLNSNRILSMLFKTLWTTFSNGLSQFSRWN